MILYTAKCFSTFSDSGLFCVSQKLCGLKVQQSLISTDFSKRQCLEHWHSFEHEITAIPVISFCTLIYYLSSQHRYPDLNLMQGSKEKEKNNNNAAQLHPIERLAKYIQCKSTQTLCLTDEGTYHYTTGTTHLMRQSAVFKLNH